MAAGDIWVFVEGMSEVDMFVVGARREKAVSQLQMTHCVY